MKNKHLTSAQRLTLSFFLVILVGSLLLSLPIMHQPGVETYYLQHLFTTVSMVCVTGLTVITVSDTYNLLGQTVCIILMQIGGLGLITLLAASTFYLKRKLSLRDQLTLQSSFAHEDNRGLRDLLKSIYRFTAIIEGTAAALLSIRFVPELGLGKGIFTSIFLAVSAFCNAGFDNLGPTSLQLRADDWLLNLIIAGLIISGGLGFIVWSEIGSTIKKGWGLRLLQWRNLWNQLSSHSHLVIKTTFILLVGGTCLTWITEWGNPATLGQYSIPEQGLISFFQSVTMRTAGFASLDYTLTRPITNLLYMIQMLIGGAPGGTAGGIKVTTAAVLVMLFRAELQGASHINYRHRTLDNRIIRQTVTIMIFFFLMYISGIALLLATQTHMDQTALVFEVTSALATVGVTMNATSQLNEVGQIIIMCLMFLGRVGPSTVILSLVTQQTNKVQYAKANIYLG